MKMHCSECNIYTMECTRYSNDTMKCKSWLFKSYFDNSCFRKRKEKGCILNITMIIETIYSANEIHAKVFPLCICTDNIISSTLCRTQMRKLEQSTWFTGIQWKTNIIINEFCNFCIWSIYSIEL